MTVTSYEPVISQTDDSPYYTSIGHRIHSDGVAVSRDLLCTAKPKAHMSRSCHINKIHYGDVLYIEGLGFKIVNDCMAQRHRKAVDILVFTKQQERAIGTRKGSKVWRIYDQETR